MPEGATGRFADAEDYQASLTDVTARFIVIEAATFDARSTSARLLNVRLVRAQETSSRVAYIVLPSTSVFVTFPTHAASVLIWNGIEVAFGDMVVHGLGEQLHQRTTGPTQWGYLAIRPSFLTKFGSALAGHSLPVPETARIVRPQRADLARLLDLHARIARAVETRPATMGHPEVGRSMENELLHAFVTCLTQAQAYGGPQPAPDHIAGLARLEGALTAHPTGAIDIRTLCEMTDLRERTLRTCCGVMLGMSPTRYIRLRRLQLARTAIVSADPSTACLADIAKHYGFSQPGRFTAVYRMAFGENPSATLARLRNRTP